MEWRWWGVCVEGGSINLREWVEWWCRGGYSTEGIRGCWSIVYADIDVVLCGMGMIVKYMSSSIRHFILLWVFSHFEPQQLIIVVILYYCRNEPKSQTLSYLIPFSCPFNHLHSYKRNSWDSSMLTTTIRILHLLSGNAHQTEIAITSILGMGCKML